MKPTLASEVDLWHLVGAQLEGALGYLGYLSMLQLMIIPLKHNTGLLMALSKIVLWAVLAHLMAVRVEGSKIWGGSKKYKKAFWSKRYQELRIQGKEIDILSCFKLILINYLTRNIYSILWRPLVWGNLLCWLSWVINGWWHRNW